MQRDADADVADEMQLPASVAAALLWQVLPMSASVARPLSLSRSHSHSRFHSRSPLPLPCATRAHICYKTCYVFDCNCLSLLPLFFYLSLSLSLSLAGSLLVLISSRAFNMACDHEINEQQRNYFLMEIGQRKMKIKLKTENSSLLLQMKMKRITQCRNVSQQADEEEEEEEEEREERFLTTFCND